MNKDRFIYRIKIIVDSENKVVYNYTHNNFQKFN